MKNTMKKAAAASVLAVSLVLAGCSDDDNNQQNTAQAGTTTVEQTQSESTRSDSGPQPTLADGSIPGESEDRDQDGSADTDRPAGPSSGPGGRSGGGSGGSGSVDLGGPVPTHASEVDTVKFAYGLNVGILTTPSGNISCGLSDVLRCGVRSYNDDAPYGEERTGGPIDTINIDESGQTNMSASSDPGPWMPGAFGADDTVEPMVLDYGEVAYYGRFACSSEESGLSCWDTDNGTGATMSRAETVLF